MAALSASRGPRRASVGGLIAGAIAGAATLVVSPWLSGPVEAVPSCFANSSGYDYGQINAEEVYGTGGDAVVQKTLEGFRSDVDVVNTSVDCQRIRSVYVFSSNYQKVMEYGWSIGKFACFNDQTFVNWSSPHAFAVAVDPVLNNGRACRKWGGTTLSAGSHQFRVSDSNQDNVWGGWLDGVAQQPGNEGWTLSFLQGPGGVNMERASAADPGFADFDNIGELHGNSWSPTDHVGSISAARYDTDPEYYLDVVSGDHVKMVK